MNRRQLLQALTATAAGIFVPEPVVRAYSFVGGWRSGRWYPVLMDGLPLMGWSGMPFGVFGDGPLSFNASDVRGVPLFATVPHSVAERHFVKRTGELPSLIDFTNSFSESRWKRADHW